MNISICICPWNGMMSKYYLIIQYCWEQQRFSVPRIVYSLGSSSKKGSLLPVGSCHDTTIVMSDCTIVTTGYHGSIRTTFISNNGITQKTCNMKYTWLPFLLLPPSGYSIWGTENLSKCVVVTNSCRLRYLSKVVMAKHSLWQQHCCQQGCINTE